MEPKYLTTPEAARYCGYHTADAIHQAVRRGRLKPAGMRGRTYTFAVQDLDALMRGPIRPIPGKRSKRTETQDDVSEKEVPK